MDKTTTALVAITAIMIAAGLVLGFDAQKELTAIEQADIEIECMQAAIDARKEGLIEWEQSNAYADLCIRERINQ